MFGFGLKHNENAWKKGSLDFKPGPKKVVLKEDEQITANEEVNED